MVEITFFNGVFLGSSSELSSESSEDSSSLLLPIAPACPFDYFTNSHIKKIETESGFSRCWNSETWKAYIVQNYTTTFAFLFFGSSSLSSELSSSLSLSSESFFCRDAFGLLPTAFLGAGVCKYKICIIMEWSGSEKDHNNVNVYKKPQNPWNQEHVTNYNAL